MYNLDQFTHKQIINSGKNAFNPINNNNNNTFFIYRALHN